MKVKEFFECILFSEDDIVEISEYDEKKGKIFKYQDYKLIKNDIYDFLDRKIIKTIPSCCTKGNKKYFKYKMLLKERENICAF